MLSLLRDLFSHQEWADAETLCAVRTHEVSLKDARLLWILNHIVLVQRLFLSVLLKRPYDLMGESAVPASFGDLIASFRDSHEGQRAFVSSLEVSQLDEKIELPFLPGSMPTVAEALMQVVMHSQNHRGQCLMRLRENGGAAPTLDFVVWAKDRPRAVWT